MSENIEGLLRLADEFADYKRRLKIDPLNHALREEFVRRLREEGLNEEAGFQVWYGKQKEGE